MRIELHHCLLFILLIAITHVLVAGAPTSRTRINIRETDDENCTRNGDVLICPCDITVNGTYYPCWIPLTNATVLPPNNTCNACPLGSFSNNITGNCTIGNICQPGQCLNPYICDRCPVGRYSNVTGSSKCLDCPAGFVAREQGTINCTACPPGHSTEGLEASSACTGCAAGYFASDWGTPYCGICDFGEYSASKASSCSKCPRGTYNDKRGQPSSSCIGCGAGYFGDGTGLASRDQCTRCPSGSYCPDTVTVAPVTCPRGSYCALGASAPVKCSSLYGSEPGQGACKPNAGFYVVIFGSVGISGIGFLIVWRWRVVKRERLQRSYQQTEIGRLIPKPRDGGPVYTGF